MQDPESGALDPLFWFALDYYLIVQVEFLEYYLYDHN